MKRAIVLATAASLGGCGGGGSDCDPSTDCGKPQDFVVTQPAAVATTQRFVAIGLGNWHSCMLGADGQAWCWGSNEYGQLGAASDRRCMSNTIDCSTAPLPVGGGQRFASLSASHRFSCGLEPTGQAWCWGFGAGGQLGDGRRTGSLAPVAVAGSHRFTFLATSLYAGLSCGLENGSPWCWGTGFSYGSTGPAASAVPQRWDAAADITWSRLALGEGQACGLDLAGAAWCMGSAAFGVLGDGSGVASATPVQVAGGRVYRDIAVSSQHACALATDGQAWCWGLGAAVGNAEPTGLTQPTPVAVAGEHRFEHISVGSNRSCGLQRDGSAWCWGEGYGGTLGDGTTQRRSTPVAVAGGRSFVALAAGGMSTCAITADGAAWCWGDNEAGAVGVPLPP